jgi:2,4-dienoyl-CoA reductase-like NADH-dependent reductase (Old Yellow Enzyme family)
MHGTLVEKETAMTCPHLHKSLSVGSLHLANRIVMPPLVIFRAGDDGAVTPTNREHYAESLGAGYVVVEATTVAPDGRLAQKQLGIFEDRHVEGLAELARIIHAGGAKAGIQIHHAGSRTSTKNTFGLPLQAPSAVISPEGEMPRALDEQGIQRVIACFMAAARRAREAGFDTVEVHGAHGYLLSQFLSPLTNTRTDAWGGSLENRARLLRTILDGIRRQEGDRLAVSCRLGLADEAEGGLTMAEGIQVARWLEEDGIAFLHVSHGIGGPPKVAPAGSPWSDRMHLGIAAKKAVRVPVIGVGEIVDPQMAETLLAEGLVDLVAVGRAILADPGWAQKSLAGRAGEIVPCRHCTRCHWFGFSERCPARAQRKRELAAVR